LLLARLGAEVIKIEPPEGNATRRIGPFWRINRARSARCFSWHYNRNKKSVLDPAGAFGARAAASSA
jgi:crotonobetainyl-CoA:carnitine CoA-transferase CaiB-like acyl-CoA transferase